MELQEQVSSFPEERLRMIRSVAEPLRVDYGRPLSELLRLGEYDWMNAHVTDDYFRPEDDGVVIAEVALFEFSADYSLPFALEQIEEYEQSRPWRPAGLWPVLEYGRRFPHMQRRFPIAGIGALARLASDDYFPYLHKMGEDRRAVYLQAVNLKCYQHMRLLAMRPA